MFPVVSLNLGEETAFWFWHNFDNLAGSLTLIWVTKASSFRNDSLSTVFNRLCGLSPDWALRNLLTPWQLGWVSFFLLYMGNILLTIWWIGRNPRTWSQHSNFNVCMVPTEIACAHKVNKDLVCLHCQTKPVWIFKADLLHYANPKLIFTSWFSICNHSWKQVEMCTIKSAMPTRYELVENALTNLRILLIALEPGNQSLVKRLLSPMCVLPGALKHAHRSWKWLVKF